MTVYERDPLSNGSGEGGGGMVDFVTVTQILACVLP